MADEKDYICITDMAAAKSDNSRATDVIRNWLRDRSTLEFLSTWEEMYNPSFKVFESEHFTINKLTVLSNLESHNAQMIREGKDKAERFEILKEIAEYQIGILNEAENISKLIGDGERDSELQ